MPNEVALDRVAGPFPSPPLPNLYVNSFGVIPKKGQPNKWHLILDMSSPLGFSVNKGIDPNDYPLQYTRVDDIVKMVSKFGQGALRPSLMWNLPTATLLFIPVIGTL